MRMTLGSGLFCFMALLLLGAAAYSLSREVHQRKAAPHKVVRVIVDIGHYPDLRAEQLDALQRLSLVLSRHPEADAVRIVAGKSAWRDGVMEYARTDPSTLDGNEKYFRFPSRSFWYDDRFASPKVGFVKGHFQGFSAERLISEEPIHMAAHQNLSLDDVWVDNELLRCRQDGSTCHWPK